MSELIIGVDVGFGNTKTSHKVFSSGVIKHSTKPPISSIVKQVALKLQPPSLRGDGPEGRGE